MRLDRNEGVTGKGKYALVLLRNVKEGSEAYGLIQRLHELGCLDEGIRHSDSEFFVIRLKDKYAEPALNAYALAAQSDDVEFAKDVAAMATRAKHHPSKKQPD
jgi:hypothetical protein